MLAWEKFVLLSAWVAQCFLRHLEVVSKKYYLFLSSFFWTAGFPTRLFFFSVSIRAVYFFFLRSSKRYCNLSYLTTYHQCCLLLKFFTLKISSSDLTTSTSGFHHCLSDKLKLSKRKWHVFHGYVGILTMMCFQEESSSWRDESGSLGYEQSVAENT